MIIKEIISIMQRLRIKGIILILSLLFMILISGIILTSIAVSIMVVEIALVREISEMRVIVHKIKDVIKNVENTVKKLAIIIKISWNKRGKLDAALRWR